MGQFSRRARWLNEIFPASKAPQTRDPAQVSGDVSLTQPYDAGGYAFDDPYIRSVGSAAGITDQVEIFRVPEDSIFRILGAGVECTVSATANLVTHLSVQTTLITNRDVTITDEVFVPIIAPARFGYQIFCPILAPGTVLFGEHRVGVAGTEMLYAVYGTMAPLGTVFRV